MARLMLLEGDRAGTTVDLVEGHTLGRHAACDLVLEHPSISRRHARVERRPDGLWLVDLGSSNGLRVAGQKVSEVMVEDGLEFSVGALEVRFVAPANAAAAADAPSAALDEDFDFADDGDASAAPRPSDSGGLALEDPAEIELGGGASPRRRPGAPGAPRDATPERPVVEAPLDRRRAEMLREVAAEPSGLLRGDLTQYPSWVQGLVWLGLLVVFAGVAWGAFALVQGAKG